MRKLDEPNSRQTTVLRWPECHLRSLSFAVLQVTELALRIELKEQEFIAVMSERSHAVLVERQEDCSLKGKCAVVSVRV